MEKMVQKGGYWFFLNLVYNENLHYFQYSCISPKFGKNMAFEVWAKVFLANQIAGFLSQIYL